MSGATEVNAESTLSLTCHSTGNPFPEILHWVHNSTVLSNSSRVIITQSTGTVFKSELNISTVGLADAGAYGCIASSGINIQAAEINITVRQGKILLLQK